MATYNPLADGDLEIDHKTARRTGLTDRVYVRLTPQGKKRRELVEDFLGTSGYRHEYDSSLVRKTKHGYVSLKYGYR